MVWRRTRTEPRSTFLFFTSDLSFAPPKPLLLTRPDSLNVWHHLEAEAKVAAAVDADAGQLHREEEEVETGQPTTATETTCLAQL